MANLLPQLIAFICICSFFVPYNIFMNLTYKFDKVQITKTYFNFKIYGHFI